MVEGIYLEKLQKQFGERIQHLRIYAGYNTQAAFAKAYTGEDKTSSILSRVENGENVSFYTITKLASTLKMPLFTLMDLDGKHPIIISEKYKTNWENRLRLELDAFAEKILQIRKSKELTLLNIEIRSGIAQSYYINYEQGKKRLYFDTINIIADALEVTLLELFPLT